MKLMLRLIFLSIIILSGCTNHNLPKIPSDKNIISTVNIKDMTISFINVDDKETLQEWKLEKPYTGGLIFPDNDTILLYGKQNDSVDLYSLKKGKKIKTWETGKGIVSGKLLKDEKLLVFADQNEHRVRFFSFKGEEVDSIKTGKNPITLLEGSEQNKLYVISFDDKKLTVIDLESKRIDKSFTIHGNAAGALLREKDNELWIGGHGEGQNIETDIHIYDLITGSLKKKIAAPTMPINFVESNESVYALSHGTSTLYKISSNGNLEETLQVGANPFEMKVMDNLLVIAGYDSNDVNLVSLDNSLQIIDTFKVGKGPFEIITREENK
ncbi:WD40 repeat domain-containing protein [Bacillus aquiflavi]|uniref:WD40 repeat domain-containing protein n=1 Tax=Bacillus aquiflavi TaxID=2672567 RepID=A0A6B3W2P1_9BACI|nr:WD40 repeat domain-containing protein [Bacillus aquiflavi]MBA4537967.1 WD40 repeat domain-containing protein [Bacillus aquiflavi]NEY82223.1 WD40 repeat domain-containing protein [Bacillus aquiflavi]UAC49880.1 WD40 repeat domain-containing protein [Bacillus aquiflavi]